MATDTAQARYDTLALSRSQRLRTAIDCSSLTIPSLIPESDQNSKHGEEPYNRLNSLYQGAGARGCSSLSAKLLLALYPPSQPFFRLVIDRGEMAKYVERSGKDEQGVITETDIGLASIERQVLAKLDRLQTRPVLFEAIKHLVVGGNALLYVGKDNLRMWGLRSYVVDRDPEGNVSEIVIKESVSAKFLPVPPRQDDEEEEVHDVYTHVLFDQRANKVEWHQEYDGTRIPNSTGFSQLDNCPYMCLRMGKIAGESYGRSITEEVLGDLQSLESLSKAIVEASLIMSRAVFLVNPNGVTRVDALSRAENGAVVAGNAADVEPLVVGKSQDLSVALQTMQVLEKRINFTYLTNESVQRDAERVSATEIKLLAEQLEAGLAGVYSMLSQDLQLPLIKRVLFLMEEEAKFPPLPVDLVNPQITTGLEAIGRGNDKQRLAEFLQITSATIGPEQMLSLINPTELVRRFAASDGIEVAGLIKTEEELAAEQNQQQQLQLQQEIASQSINARARNAGQPGQEAPPTAA